MPYNFTSRPRRLRNNQNLGEILSENSLQLRNLIYPVFISNEIERAEKIESMPGIYRWPFRDIESKFGEWSDKGLRSFAIFPCIPKHLKNDTGSEILESNSLSYQINNKVKSTHPDLVLFGDLALDPYTTHGHDGIIDPSGNVLNDETVEILAQAATLAASSGYDFVAPSDMMDGRVSVIRKTLDKSGYVNTGIMSYSAKFCSAYYGPFRDAIGSAKAVPIDKSTYQLRPSNKREAARELLLDENEGADILLIKPAEPYLDIISYAKEAHNLPIAAYQVSGEYSRILAAASNGWLDLNACSMESLISIKRAGADLIITYFAEKISEMLDPA